jgi:serine/threonine protein kinase
MGYNQFPEAFPMNTPTIVPPPPFNAATGTSNLDPFNSIGAWAGRAPSPGGNGIIRQSIENAQFDGQLMSVTKVLDIFRLTVDLDSSILSSAKQSIQEAALKIERILQDPSSYDSITSPATQTQLSQFESFQNPTTVMSSSGASASAMSANSRGGTRTTASHISTQTHVTVPGSIQSSDHDHNDIGERVYHHCTEKNCSKSFTRRSDWIRHEETHWPQQRYLCLYCIPEGHMVDGSYWCGSCQCLTPNDWESHSLSCPGAQFKGKSFTRWVHLRDHLFTAHRVPVSTGKGLAQKWPYDPESDWPRQCGFCGKNFGDWKKRINHVGRHFTEEHATIDKWTIPFVLSPADVVEPTLSYKDEDDPDDDVRRGRPRASQAPPMSLASFSGQGNPSNQAYNDGQYSSGQRQVGYYSSHRECTISIVDAKIECRAHSNTFVHSNVATPQVAQKPASRVFLRRSSQKSVPVQFDHFVKDQLPQVFQEVKGLDEYFCSYIKDLFGFTTVPGGVFTAMSPVREETLRWRMLEPSDNNGPFPNRLDYFAIWAGCLASAVDFLHEHNMVHRGLTSTNVFVQGTMVLLYDFEAMINERGSFDANSFHSASPMTRTGSIAFLGCVFIELMTVLEGIPLSDMLASCAESPETPSDYLSSCQNWIRSLSGRIESRSNITMVERMISHNAEERPTSRDVRAHFAGPACFCQDGYFESRSEDKISSWCNILTKRLPSSIAPTEFSSLLKHVPTGPTPLDLYVAEIKTLDEERSINIQALQRISTQSDYTFDTALSRSQTLTVRPASSVTTMSSGSAQSKTVPVITLPRQTPNLNTMQSITLSDIDEAPQTAEERKCTLACVSSSTGFSTYSKEGQIPRSPVHFQDILSSLNACILSTSTNIMDNESPDPTDDQVQKLNSIYLV